MSAPLLFVGLPLMLAPILYWLWQGTPAPEAGRRAATTVAVGVTALLALLAVGLPLDEPVPWLLGATLNSTLTVLGRSFVMDASNRIALAFVFAQAALLFLFTRQATPGRFYLGAALAALGLLAAALFVKPFLFAALFLELAAALTVFVLADEARPLTRGALRFFVFLTLSLPFVLLTGWLLEGSAASPGDPSFLTRATVLLGLGFAILLAVVPFHSWIPVVAEQASPVAAAFVFTALRVVPVFLMLTFLDAFDWLGQNALVYRALTVAGGGTALVGALFAFGQHNFGRVLGYAVMIDTGAVLLGVGLQTPAGVQAALGTLAFGTLAIILWAVGLGRLRRAARGDDFDALRGLARRYPFSAAAVAFGLLSLVGFPVTAGFPARWSLLWLLAHAHPTGAILLILGMVSVGVVCARGLAALLTPTDEETTLAESPLTVVTAAGGVFAILLFGFFPQWMLTTVAGAVSVFTHLAP